MRHPVLLALWLGLWSGCLELPALPRASPLRDRASDAGAADAATSSCSLRVGAWNVRRLGAALEADLPRIARIIDAHFDLVALVEVMHVEGVGAAGYHALLEQLGPGWGGQVTATPRPNTTSPYAEYYAVLQRRGSVAPCRDMPELRFFPDGDGSDRASGGDAFLREPAFGCYVARQSPAQGLDFMLGVYHARWGSGDPAEIAEEVARIDDVLAWQRAERPEERDIFLVGDFNLDSAALGGLVRARDRTDGSGSTVQREGHITGNLLDHLLVLDPEASRELLESARVLDVRHEEGTPLSYVRNVSDHLPIQAHLDCSLGDDD